MDTWVFERVGSDVVPSLVRLGARLRDRVRRRGRRSGSRSGSRARCAAPPTRSCSSCARSRRPALLPFGILVLGVGNAMKIFIIAFVCLWPVLLNTIDGVAGVDPTLRETARVYGIGGARPAAARDAAGGRAADLRGDAHGALAGADPDGDLARWSRRRNGIGYFVLQSQRSFAIPEMWSGILLLGILGYVLNATLPAGRAARAPVAPRRPGQRAELTCCASNT